MSAIEFFLFFVFSNTDLEGILCKFITSLAANLQGTLQVYCDFVLQVLKLALQVLHAKTQTYIVRF